MSLLESNRSRSGYRAVTDGRRGERASSLPPPFCVLTDTRCIAPLAIDYVANISRDNAHSSASCTVVGSTTATKKNEDVVDRP